MSFGRNYYTLVIMDDYSRYTWPHLLSRKKDALFAFQKLVKGIQNKKKH